MESELAHRDLRRVQTASWSIQPPYAGPYGLTSPSRLSRIQVVVEQGDDKIPRGHAALLLGEGRHADQHGRVVGLQQAQKYVLLVCKVLYI